MGEIFTADEKAYRRSDKKSAQNIIRELGK